MQYVALIALAVAVVCFLASIACGLLMVVAAKRQLQVTTVEAMVEIYKARGGSLGPRIRLYFVIWERALAAGFVLLVLGLVLG